MSFGTVVLLFTFVYCDEGVGQAVTDVNLHNKLVGVGGEVEFDGVTDNILDGVLKYSLVEYDK
jgi:hypothetical protein